jgi:hypothetical protein
VDKWKTPQVGVITEKASKEFAPNGTHKILRRGALPPCDPPGYLGRNDGEAMVVPIAKPKSLQSKAI